MASVETTTIRVRRSTHERLSEAAELAGKSVTQLVEEMADLLEQTRMVEEHFEAMHRYENLPEEVKARDIAIEEEFVRELEAMPPLEDRD